MLIRFLANCKIKFYFFILFTLLFSTVNYSKVLELNQNTSYNEALNSFVKHYYTFKNIPNADSIIIRASSKDDSFKLGQISIFASFNYKFASDERSAQYYSIKKTENIILINNLNSNQESGFLTVECDDACDYILTIQYIMNNMIIQVEKEKEYNYTLSDVIPLSLKQSEIQYNFIDIIAYGNFGLTPKLIISSDNKSKFIHDNEQGTSFGFSGQIVRIHRDEMRLCVGCNLDIYLLSTKDCFNASVSIFIRYDFSIIDLNDGQRYYYQEDSLTQSTFVMKIDSLSKNYINIEAFLLEEEEKSANVSIFHQSFNNDNEKSNFESEFRDDDSLLNPIKTQDPVNNNIYSYQVNLDGLVRDQSKTFYIYVLLKSNDKIDFSIKLSSTTEPNEFSSLNNTQKNISISAGSYKVINILTYIDVFSIQATLFDTYKETEFYLLYCSSVNKTECSLETIKNRINSQHFSNTLIKSKENLIKSFNYCSLDNNLESNLNCQIKIILKCLAPIDCNTSLLVKEDTDGTKKNSLVLNINEKQFYSIIPFSTFDFDINFFSNLKDLNLKNPQLLIKIQVFSGKISYISKLSNKSESKLNEKMVVNQEVTLIDCLDIDNFTNMSIQIQSVNFSRFMIAYSLKEKALNSNNILVPISPNCLECTFNYNQSVIYTIQAQINPIKIYLLPKINAEISFNVYFAIEDVGKEEKSIFSSSSIVLIEKNTNVYIQLNAQSVNDEYILTYSQEDDSLISSYTEFYVKSNPQEVLSLRFLNISNTSTIQIAKLTGSIKYILDAESNIIVEDNLIIPFDYYKELRIFSDEREITEYLIKINPGESSNNMFLISSKIFSFSLKNGELRKFSFIIDDINQSSLINISTDDGDVEYKVEFSCQDIIDKYSTQGVIKNNQSNSIIVSAFYLKNLQNKQFCSGRGSFLAKSNNGVDDVNISVVYFDDYINLPSNKVYKNVIRNGTYQYFKFSISKLVKSFSVVLNSISGDSYIFMNKRIPGKNMILDKENSQYSSSHKAQIDIINISSNTEGDYELAIYAFTNSEYTLYLNTLAENIGYVSDDQSSSCILNDAGTCYFIYDDPYDNINEIRPFVTHVNYIYGQGTIFTKYLTLKEYYSITNSNNVSLLPSDKFFDFSSGSNKYLISPYSSVTRSSFDSSYKESNYEKGLVIIFVKTTGPVSLQIQTSEQMVKDIKTRLIKMNTLNYVFASSTITTVDFMVMVPPGPMDQRPFFDNICYYIELIGGGNGFKVIYDKDQSIFLDTTTTNKLICPVIRKDIFTITDFNEDMILMIKPFIPSPIKNLNLNTKSTDIININNGLNGYIDITSYLPILNQLQFILNISNNTLRLSVYFKLYLLNKENIQNLDFNSNNIYIPSRSNYDYLISNSLFEDDIRFDLNYDFKRISTELNEKKAFIFFSVNVGLFQLMNYFENSTGLKSQIDITFNTSLDDAKDSIYVEPNQVIRSDGNKLFKIKKSDINHDAYYYQISTCGEKDLKFIILDQVGKEAFSKKVDNNFDTSIVSKELILYFKIEPSDDKQYIFQYSSFSTISKEFSNQPKLPSDTNIKISLKNLNLSFSFNPLSQPDAKYIGVFIPDIKENKGIKLDQSKGSSHNSSSICTLLQFSNTPLFVAKDSKDKVIENNLVLKKNELLKGEFNILAKHPSYSKLFVYKYIEIQIDNRGGIMYLITEKLGLNLIVFIATTSALVIIIIVIIICFCKWKRRQRDLKIRRESKASQKDKQTKIEVKEAAIVVEVKDTDKINKKNEEYGKELDMISNLDKSATTNRDNMSAITYRKDEEDGTKLEKKKEVSEFTA